MVLDLLTNSQSTTFNYIKSYAKLPEGYDRTWLILSKNNKSRRREYKSLVDTDWCGDRVDKMSTFGYFFMQAPISWCSRKQNVVTLSLCKAEYIMLVYGRVVLGPTRRSWPGSSRPR